MPGNSRINQEDIPTLPALYASGEINPGSETPPVFAPSAELNKKIGLIRHDITTLVLPEGAIVNAANRGLLGGGGVDGAIHRAAGDELYDECATLNGCNTGSAKITGAYEIPCKKIIHAVGPIYGSVKHPEDLLASCYKTSLDLAVEEGLKVVAFSALSTGVYGYPSMEAADVVLETVREYLESEKGKKLDLVVFCNFEMKDVNAYHLTIPLYFPPPATQTSEASDSTSTEAPGDKAEENTKGTVQETKSTEKEEEAKSPEKAATSTAELPEDEAIDKGAEGAMTPEEAKSAAEKKSTDKPATTA